MDLIKITNKSGKVSLNEAVTSTSIKRMIDEIGKLFGADAAASGADFGPMMACVESAVNSLEIEINSQGGSVFDGYTIYNEIKSLRQRGVQVNATITGMAASMASVICMACDVVKIVPHGRMMIHDASNSVSGNAEKMRVMAELLDGISSDISDIYAERTGKDTAIIRALMKAETWMNAKEAKALGFVDEIHDPSVKKNELDLNATFVHLHTPDDMKFLDKLLAPSNEEVFAQLEAVKTDLANAEAANTESLGKLQTAELALQEAATEIINLRSSETTITAELETVRAEIATLTASLTEAETRITPEAIQALVTAQIAGSGHPPLVVEGSVTHGNDDKSMTLTNFNSLTPKARMAFVKSGGKLTD